MNYQYARDFFIWRTPSGPLPPRSVVLSLLAVVSLVMLSVFALVGCWIPKTQSQRPQTPIAVQQPVADPLPNLSPEDYAELSGFDASTEQTLREQVRNNDIEWRVEKLEREVRRLNQRIYGVAELRIGDEPSPSEEQAP